MSQFQRMVVIPQEEYMQLSTVQNVRQPLTQQFYNLESRYNQESQVQDPYKRLALQSETLDDMKQLKDQMRHYIMINTPKPYRTRAQALLENLSAFIRFNERGEIYDKGSNIIANSRMEDLIQHAVRDRRRNISPIGWSYFLSLLRDHNIPKSILNRSTIEEMERREEVGVKVIKHESPEALKHELKKKKKIVKRVKPYNFPLRSKSERKRKLPQKLLDSVSSY